MSFFRGFSHEVVSLSAWILGLWVALKYAHFFQPYCLRWFSSWVSSFSVSYFIAFMGLFLIVLLIGMLVNTLLSMMINKAGISLGNRCMGMIFGVLRGMIVVAMLLWLFMNVGGTSAKMVTLRESVMAEKFHPMVIWLNRFLPATMKHMQHWIGTASTTKR